jgi:CRP-like cAMP-binding protein
MIELLEVLDEMYKIYPLTPECIESLSRIAQIKQVPKQTYLLKAGQVMTQSYYIKSGLIRAFQKTNSGEVTSFFMKEKDIFVNPESFYDQTPSFDYIQTLEDSEVIYSAKKDVDEMYLKHLEFNFVARVITEKYNKLQWKYNRIKVLKPMVERYKVFSEEFPDLVDRVDAQHIASFLAITPEHLSKLKKALKKN